MARVLVVDDDDVARQVFSAALHQEGHRVALASSGGDAIQHISTGALPDAMFLDLNLGDMTGYDVLRWMCVQHRMVATVVMTAFPVEFDPDEAIELGAIAYADHTLSIEELVAVANSISMSRAPHDDPQRLHVRVLVGDSLALEHLDAAFLRIIPRRLEKSFPRVPWDFAVDAAVDASLEYSAAPHSFDAVRLPSVIDFVYMIARRNLLNRFDSELKRKQRERRYSQQQQLASSFQLEVER